MILEKIKVKKTVLGKSPRSEGDLYRINIAYKGHKHVFEFHDRKENDSGIKEFMYAIIGDAHAYEKYKGIDKFQQAYTFKNFNECLHSYRGCRASSRALHRMFTDEEFAQVEKEVNE